MGPPASGSRPRKPNYRANPKKLLIIDLRRPDELVKYGSFPAYLSLQLKDLPELLEYVPKDCTILYLASGSWIKPATPAQAAPANTASSAVNTSTSTKAPAW